MSIFLGKANNEDSVQEITIPEYTPDEQKIKNDVKRLIERVNNLELTEVTDTTPDSDEQDQSDKQNESDEQKGENVPAPNDQKQLGDIEPVWLIGGAVAVGILGYIIIK